MKDVLYYYSHMLNLCRILATILSLLAFSLCQGADDCLPADETTSAQQKIIADMENAAKLIQKTWRVKKDQICLRNSEGYRMILLKSLEDAHGVESDGTLNEAGVAKVLMDLGYAPVSLDLVHLEKHAIPAHPGNVFLVKLKTPEGKYSPYLVIKQFKDSGNLKKEIKNFATIRSSQLAQTPLPALHQNFPQVMWDEGSYCYKIGDRDQCFSILHFAKGSRLIDTFREALGIQRNTDSTLTLQAKKEIGQKALYRMGTALGSLHHRYLKNEEAPIKEWKSFVHGDLNMRNIFYDPLKDRISFIDNEGFEKSVLEKKPIHNDLFAFIANSAMIGALKKDEGLKQGIRSLFEKFI